MKNEIKKLELQINQNQTTVNNLLDKYYKDDNVKPSSYDINMKAYSLRDGADRGGDELLFSDDEIIDLYWCLENIKKDKERLNFCEEVLYSDDIVKELYSIENLNEYLKNGWKMWGAPMSNICEGDNGSYSSGALQRIIRKDYKN